MIYIPNQLDMQPKHEKAAAEAELNSLFVLTTCLMFSHLPYSTIRPRNGAARNAFNRFQTAPHARIHSAHKYFNSSAFYVLTE